MRADIIKAKSSNLESMDLADLKKLIDTENLPVRMDTGGNQSRSLEEIRADIIAARKAAATGKTTAKERESESRSKIATITARGTPMLPSPREPKLSSSL